MLYRIVTVYICTVSDHCFSVKPCTATIHLYIVQLKDFTVRYRVGDKTNCIYMLCPCHLFHCTGVAEPFHTLIQNNYYCIAVRNMIYDAASCTAQYSSCASCELYSTCNLSEESCVGDFISQLI